LVGKDYGPDPLFAETIEHRSPELSAVIKLFMLTATAPARCGKNVWLKQLVID